MRKINPRIRDQFGKTRRHIRNIIDSVVYIINLTAPSELSVDCLTDSLFIVLHNISLDRNAVHRRLLQNTHVTDPDHAHMKSSWDRSCRQCQYINVFLELLNLFLMDNAKTLFLVNDQQTKVFESDIF